MSENLDKIVTQLLFCFAYFNERLKNRLNVALTSFELAVHVVGFPLFPER